MNAAPSYADALIHSCSQQTDTIITVTVIIIHVRAINVAATSILTTSLVWH